MASLGVDLIGRVDAARLRETTLDLVRTPSPTGDCAAVAELYAAILRAAGMAVEVVHHDGYPSSPSVVARLQGVRPGRTLQFDGHLDTIHARHTPPCFEAGCIHGRGAADMKSGLAAVAEVARVLGEAGSRLAGDLLMTAHGMHEAPWALGETLRLLIEAGHVGDAVVCAEGANDELPVVGKGLGIFEVTIRREGDAVHELQAAPGIVHPIEVGTRLAMAILAENARLSATELPHGLGPESYFIGVFESGDFYNRVPTTCRIVGTHRYGPQRDFSDVEAEFRALVQGAAYESAAAVEFRFWRQRDGFQLNPEEAVTMALRRAYEQLHGCSLPLVGMSYVADSSIFIREGGVPALQYGTGVARAHADREWVPLEDVVNTTKVLLLTAIEYLGLAQ